MSRRPIHVMHVTESAGGVETYLLLILKHIDRTRFKMSIACRSDKGSIAVEAERLGAQVYPIPFAWEVSPAHDVSCLVRLIQLLREVSPDLVHAHSSKAGVLARVASRLCGVPCVFTPHAYAFLGAAGLKRSFYLAVERSMRPLTKFVVAGSPSEWKRAVEDVGFPEESVRLFQNSIDVSLEDSGVAHGENWGSQPPSVLMVGRICHQKNPEMFVRIAAMVNKEIGNVRFILIGGGFDERNGASVRDLINRLRLADAFEILPWLPKTELAGVVKDSSVVVVPSRFESFGYVAAEAGLLGKPVVATRVDGLRDVIRDGETGILVDSGDDETMASAVIDLLQNPDAARSLGERGRMRIQTCFNIEVNIKALSEIYDGVFTVGSGG